MIGLMDHKLTFDFTIMTHEHTVLNTPQSHTFLSIHLKHRITQFAKGNIRIEMIFLRLSLYCFSAAAYTFCVKWVVVDLKLLDGIYYDIGLCFVQLIEY